MSTVLKIGPEDHGRPMTLEEFQSGDYQEGFHYEIIAGRLYVSPKANYPQNRLEGWLYDELTFSNANIPRSSITPPSVPGCWYPTAQG